MVKLLHIVALRSPESLENLADKLQHVEEVLLTRIGLLEAEAQDKDPAIFGVLHGDIARHLRRVEVPHGLPVSATSTEKSARVEMRSR